MIDDANVLYKALSARDARFDGVFFVGVTSTGIYCRPICPARTPLRKHCVFFTSAHAAEHSRFRPCLRCRPELAPGNAPIDASQRIAQLIMQRLEEGGLDGADGLDEGEGGGLEAIAAQFHLSSRQIRRIVQKELGVPPMQLIQTRRLLLAKQLLTETRLPVTQIAFASGFASLRRFNDAFSSRYGLAPSQLRKQALAGDAMAADAAETSILKLAYRPPYDWDGVLAFLATRGLMGVEWVTGDAYARTVELNGHRGWIKVTHARRKHTLLIEFSHGLARVLPALLSRVRDLFDLSARPDVISRQLRKDRRLAPLVKLTPGLRVPGAFSGFELGMRAILGQQVTVRAATTLASRFVTAFGEPIVTPHAELHRLSPTPARIAAASVDEIARLGIVSARSRCLIALAQAQASGELSLEHGVHPDPAAAIERLVQLPGIGPWTAHYIAMRALRWPDAFPKEDIVIRNTLGGVSSQVAEQMSLAWRPWRSYAVLHLWKHSAAPVKAPSRRLNGPSPGSAASPDSRS